VPAVVANAIAAPAPVAEIPEMVPPVTTTDIPSVTFSLEPVAKNANLAPTKAWPVAPALAAYTPPVVVSEVVRVSANQPICEKFWSAVGPTLVSTVPLPSAVVAIIRILSR